MGFGVENTILHEIQRSLKRLKSSLPPIFYLFAVHLFEVFYPKKKNRLYAVQLKTGSTFRYDCKKKKSLIFCFKKKIQLPPSPSPCIFKPPKMSFQHFGKNSHFGNSEEFSIRPPPTSNLWTRQEDFPLCVSYVSKVNLLIHCVCNNTHSKKWLDS